MEINLGNNFGNLGVGRETADIKASDAGRETASASQTARLKSNLTITEGAAALKSAEPVTDVAESDLTRDDELGNLVNAAFNFRPPPMPSFVD